MQMAKNAPSSDSPSSNAISPPPITLFLSVQIHTPGEWLTRILGTEKMRAHRTVSCCQTIFRTHEEEEKQPQIRKTRGGFWMDHSLTVTRLFKFPFPFPPPLVCFFFSHLLTASSIEVWRVAGRDRIKKRGKGGGEKEGKRERDEGIAASRAPFVMLRLWVGKASKGFKLSGVMLLPRSSSIEYTQHVHSSSTFHKPPHYT